MPTPGLPFRSRAALLVQREVGRLLGPVWIPVVVTAVHLVFGWRIDEIRETRREFKRLRSGSSSPLLVCANHLTMVDSFLIAISLGSPWTFISRYASLPWNTPDRENFANTWSSRILVYLLKCVPVNRGGDRAEIGQVLKKITWLLSIGEVALIFPEGGRSRTGRVDTEAVTYGIGRIVRALPGCQVLCVYLRGDRQESYTATPAKGDRFRVRLRTMEPKTMQRGLRGSLDISRQILEQLAEMEREHFDDRK